MIFSTSSMLFLHNWTAPQSSDVTTLTVDSVVSSCMFLQVSTELVPGDFVVFVLVIPCQHHLFGSGMHGNKRRIYFDRMFKNIAIVLTVASFCAVSLSFPSSMRTVSSSLQLIWPELSRSNLSKTSRHLSKLFIILNGFSSDRLNRRMQQCWVVKWAKVSFLIVMLSS